MQEKLIYNMEYGGKLLDSSKKCIIRLIVNNI